MRWLVRPVIPQYEPSVASYRLSDQLPVQRRRVRHEVFEVVGLLGRYPVYSPISERLLEQRQVMVAIRRRLGTYRRLPLPD